MYFCSFISVGLKTRKESPFPDCSLSLSLRVMWFCVDLDPLRVSTCKVSSVCGRRHTIGVLKSNMHDCDKTSLLSPSQNYPRRTFSDVFVESHRNWWLKMSRQECERINGGICVLRRHLNNVSDKIRHLTVCRYSRSFGSGLNSKRPYNSSFVLFSFFGVPGLFKANCT